VVSLLALFVAAQPVQVPEYWQQDVHYTIEASLDESDGVLHGAATMVYDNRSPDSLDALYFHLHLNAFRPGSLWSQVERRPQLQFGDLEDPDFAYERMKSLRIGGRELELSYPNAPDSTVVRVALHEPLAPGGSVTVSLEWDARLATLCRRQCRQGRQYDFAQWYPRIAPYDADGWQEHPLYPQGEFYGEFATYDVTLDLAEDQVVGATGVPIAGDPGWRPTATSPLQQPLDRSGAYAERLEAVSPEALDGVPAAGRKRVRFYAEDVHHFAWSVNPAYLYEGGTLGDIAIHVLFLPGDVEWDLGSVVNKTARALEWLQEAVGPYPWPQLTITHRLDGGGTEFPMFIGNGGPSQGLIVHEAAHQFAHGALANNEWRHAWLDEGMASFLTNWFMEDHGVADPWSGSVNRVAQADAAGLPVPVDTLSEDMPDFGTYGVLAYTKPSVMYRMLREYMGREAFRVGMNAYYDDKKLEHVVEADFRRHMEAAAGEDLGWFFDQWLRTTDGIDFAVGEVTQIQDRAGRWTTTVEVRRRGDAWMPVDVLVGDARVQATSRDRSQTVTVTTSVRPEFVVLDPDWVLPDMNRNNTMARIEP
jgi:hypothetical protein